MSKKFMKKILLIVIALLFAVLLFWLGFFLKTNNPLIPSLSKTDPVTGYQVMVSDWAVEYKYGLPFHAYSRWVGFTPSDYQYNKAGIAANLVVILILMVIFTRLLNKLLYKTYGRNITEHSLPNE